MMITARVITANLLAANIADGFAGIRVTAAQIGMMRNLNASRTGLAEKKVEVRKMRKLNLYELLKMIDYNDLELPLYADTKGKIGCEPQSVYKVTLRFSAEDDAAVTVPISSPLLIPWYDCVVYSFSPNDIEDSMDVWLNYNEYVLKKWSRKIIQEVSEDAGSKTD